MKKLFIAMILVATGLLVTGQVVTEARYTLENPETMTRQDYPEYECYPVSAYSQLVPYDADAITSYGSYYTGSPYRVYDNILNKPAFPFNEVTFWGVIWGPEHTQFEIAFYTNNSGMPGTLIASYMVTATYEPTPIWDLRRYHAVLPEKLDLPQGTLISIGADANVGWWFWTMSHDGDLSAYQSETGTLFNDVSFCLGSQLEIPLSNYSLLLGLALIAVFVIVKARRA